MLPIVEFPGVVTRDAVHFDSLFDNAQQREHFREYVSGLILAQQPIVQAINALFVKRNDQSALNKFLTQAVWDEQALNTRRVQLEKEAVQRAGLSARHGYLVVDDTCAQHVGQPIELMAKLWDHAEQRYSWAHDLVTSFYVNGAQPFPVNFRLWLQFMEKAERQALRAPRAARGQSPTLEPQRACLQALVWCGSRQQAYRTKHQLAAEWVSAAVAHGLPFATVLFDRWYLHSHLLDALELQHKDWIGGLPQDRLVKWQGEWLQVQASLKTIPAQADRRVEIGRQSYGAFSKVLDVKSLPRRVRLLASYDNPELKGEPQLLVSNRKDWEGVHSLTRFSYRWPTETFNADAKQHWGLEAYQLRQVLGIKRHGYLIFLAYAFLRLDAQPSRLLKLVTTGFETTGQRCRATAQEMVQALVTGLYKQFTAQQSAAAIMQILCPASWAVCSRCDRLGGRRCVTVRSLHAPSVQAITRRSLRLTSNRKSRVK